MPGFKDHPLDAPLAVIVKAMDDADHQMQQMATGIGDFDSHELSPEEDLLLFDNPHLRYVDQVEPITGLPYTNAQATVQYRKDVGDVAYVAYVEDVVRRMDRRQSDNPQPTDAPLEQTDQEVTDG